MTAAPLIRVHSWRPVLGLRDGACFFDGCGQRKAAHATGFNGWKNSQALWEILPGDRHPDWLLRASFTAPIPGHPKPKIHLYDGVRGACGRGPDTSAHKHATLTFHPPATGHTCAACTDRSHYPSPLTLRSATPAYDDTELHTAAARLLDHADRTRDPAAARAALRLLAAPGPLESLAHLIATTRPALARDHLHDALTRLNDTPTGPYYLGRDLTVPHRAYRIRPDRQNPTGDTLTLTPDQARAFLTGLAAAADTLARAANRALGANTFGRAIADHVGSRLSPYTGAYTDAADTARKDTP